MAGSAEILRIHNLDFAYGKQPVLQGLSVTLWSSQLTGLLALNGQGKSTLLKLIAGILPLNMPVVEYRMNDKKLGYMPERPLFFPDLSVTDNVLYAARIHQLDNESITTAVNAVLARWRLQAVSLKLAGSLSKGYQQRLGMAMAMVHTPSLMLLDEPTDGMDPEQLTEAWALITAQKQSSSILVSSHRISEIAEHCDRVLIMHQGCICEDLLLDSVAQRQQLAERFSAVTRGADQ